MAVELGDIIAQIGSGTYRLVKGKDVDLTNADAMGDALADADLILIDDAAAGTQASTKKATLSQLLTYVQASIVDSAPGTLDTLNELAAALGDDENFSTTMTNSLALKAPLASPTFTGTIAIPNIANLETAVTANTAKVTFPGFGTTGGTALEGNTAIPVDLTVDGAGTVHPNNYTNTTYSVGDGGLTEKNFTTALNSKLSGIATGAEVNVQSDWDAGPTSDAHILNKPTIPSGNAIIDWEAESAGTIHASNYTNTTYSIGDGGLTQNNFTNDDHTKLDGIEALADVTDTANVTAAGALMDTELTDLAGVKGVTISTLQVKPSEGAFDDGDKTKLDGIATNANNYTHTTNANLTGHITSVGNATSLGTFTVAQLSTALSDATLSGNNTGDQTVAYTSPIAEGNSGLVPSAGSAGEFLAHDGTFATPPDTNTQLDNAGVIGKVLTGLDVSGGGAVAAADTILEAFGKLENRVALNDAKVTNTDIDVSIDNLETRLGEIDTSITIGADLTIDTAIGGELTVNNGVLNINAPVGSSSSFYMRADGGGDDGETWWMYVKGNNDTFNITNDKDGSNQIQFSIIPDASSKAQSIVKLSGILAIEGEQGSAPSAPTDGKGGYLYTKADGKPYWRSHELNDVDLSSGGGGKWIWESSFRWYTRYDDYYTYSNLYGARTVNWSKSHASIPYWWSAAYNPGIVVPQDCTLTSYMGFGKFTSNQTYELKVYVIHQDTPVNNFSYGSAFAVGDGDLTQIGSTQTQATTSTGAMYKVGQTGLSVSLKEGDIIWPFLRRTTSNTASYYFWYCNFQLIATID